MYQLREISFKGTEETIKNIDNKTAETLLSCMKYLGKNMKSYFYYQIVKRNLNELISFIMDKQNKLIDIDLVECNRLLFNYVDTLYAFTNYFENNYKQEFSIVKKNVYDTQFEYRLIYHFRNYMIHEDLGILSFTSKIGKEEISYQFNIETKRISSSTRVPKAIKDEIDKKFNETSIDILPVLQKQYEILKLMQEKMLSMLSEDILTNFDYLAENIINQNETFLLKDEKIINSLLNVTTKFYSNLANNFVYEENYMETDNSIRKLFMSLSFSYYREANVIYNSTKYKRM